MSTEHPSKPACHIAKFTKSWIKMQEDTRQNLPTKKIYNLRRLKKIFNEKTSDRNRYQKSSEPWDLEVFIKEMTFKLRFKDPQN